MMEMGDSLKHNGQGDTSQEANTTILNECGQPIKRGEMSPLESHFVGV